jgi:UDP-galactopyranose mutase
MKIAIIGSGFSGSVIAYKLAEAGYECDVFEQRSHVGGNCYTEKDKVTNIMLHKYGPHIFHTEDKEVWDFVNQFTEFKNFVLRVKTTINNEVFSLPINLHTINQFFKKAFTPNEAKAYIESISVNNAEIISFEDQALKFVGKDIYEAFFKGYTLKQWGVEPKHLPASILKRLPLRFNYDDNYFNHPYQGIPEGGYTKIFEKLLDRKNIRLFLNTSFDSNDIHSYDHVIYTGPLDGFFNYAEGELGYRTLDFIEEHHIGDYQGCPLMNYGNHDVPYTRITEHKFFEPWNTSDRTVIYKEFSRQAKKEDIPYYPIRLTNEKNTLKKYHSRALKQKKISFVGRLATYRYIDMDVTIRDALDASKIIIDSLSKKYTIPVFFTEVL